MQLLNLVLQRTVFVKLFFTVKFKILYPPFEFIL
jgi:hypothetical protein